jgi:hypothetical protein
MVNCTEKWLQVAWKRSISGTDTAKLGALGKAAIAKAITINNKPARFIEKPSESHHVILTTLYRTKCLEVTHY